MKIQQEVKWQLNTSTGIRQTVVFHMYARFLYTQVANHLHMKLLHMDRHHCTSSNLSPQLPGNTHDPTLGPASQLDERKTCS